MENENLEEGRGKRGQARQAGRTQDDEWGNSGRQKKSFKNFRDNARKQKQAQYEEVEQIDELSKKTLSNYVKRAADELHDRAAEQGHHGARQKWDSYEKAEREASNKRNGIKRATDKLTQEGLEAIELGINEYFAALGEEIDQDTFDSIVEDVAANLVADLTEAEEGSVLEFNNKDNKKSKEDIIESVVDKYASEVEYNELTEEEYVIDCLSKHLNEKTIVKVLELYDMLDEENKEELLDLIETREGINEVLNFIIEDKASEEE